MGWMPSAQKKRITDRTSSFLRPFSTIPIVRLTLWKHALPALVNKREERTNIKQGHSAVSIAFTRIKQVISPSDFTS
jgi:hypothetical protein